MRTVAEPLTQARHNINYGELDIRTLRNPVPPKITELIADFEKAGFVHRGGKEVIEIMSTRK
jgi:hypothetical protein